MTPTTTEASSLPEGQKGAPTLIACLLIIMAVAAAEYAMGRQAICACGQVKLWHGVVNSAENSQHIFDWYTPSHIVHGFLFYGAFHAIGRWCGRVLPLAAGLLGALAVEGLWEIAENSPLIIERYRSATISLGYNGDSIVNSMADILAMITGFLLATRLHVAFSIAFVLFAELLVGWLIRDNLTLNIIMLLWPMDWIKAWQSGIP